MSLLTLAPPSLRTLSYMVLALASFATAISLSRRISSSRRVLRGRIFSSLTDLRLLYLCIGTLVLTVFSRPLGFGSGGVPDSKV